MDIKKETPMTLQQKKEISLEVLKVIDSFCKENDIKYSLGYGSLLGAVRHKGFIPWDDDIDIIMLREEYNRFLELCVTSLPENYKCITFEDGTYYLPYTKIVDTRTHVITESFLGKEGLGIYVDVFPLDRLANDQKKAMKIKSKAKIIGKLIRYTSYNNLKEVCGDKFRLDKAILYFLAKSIGFKKASSILRQKAKKLNSTGAKWVGFLGSGSESNKNVFDINDIKETTYGEFEGVYFPMVKNYDAVLKTIYGEYMTWPPADKRVAHSEKAFFK